MTDQLRSTSVRPPNEEWFGESECAGCKRGGCGWSLVPDTGASRTGTRSVLSRPCRGGGPSRAGRRKERRWRVEDGRWPDDKGQRTGDWKVAKHPAVAGLESLPYAGAGTGGGSESKKFSGGRRRRGRKFGGSGRWKLHIMTPSSTPQRRLSPPEFYSIKGPVREMIKPFAWLILFLPVAAFAQIDPVKHDLIQMGYNQPIEGQSPVSGYAYYYHNQPDFIRTNMTLRVALAPVYLDSELGFINGLGPHTDLAFGAAGGGFADSYNEIHGGSFIKEQSFEGHGGELSASVYHLFNPNDLIPLNLVFHSAAHYSTFNRNDSTSDAFVPPDDGMDFSLSLIHISEP